MEGDRGAEVYVHPVIEEEEEERGRECLSIRLLCCDGREGRTKMLFSSVVSLEE